MLLDFPLVHQDVQLQHVGQGQFRLAFLQATPLTLYRTGDQRCERGGPGIAAQDTVDGAPGPGTGAGFPEPNTSDTMLAASP